MKRLFLRLAMTLAFVCLLLMGFLPATVSAHVQRPATQNCSANNACVGDVVWGNSTNYPIVGAQSNMTISNPGFSLANSDWIRSLSIYSAVNHGEIETGMEKVGSGNNHVNCSGGNTLWFFIHVVTPTGLNEPTFCRVIPSGDINAQANFKISRNADSSYEIIVDYKNHDSPCEGSGCSEYNIAASVYHYIKLHEDIYDTWTGVHKVWGSAWGYNMYQDPSTRNFYYQPQACSGPSGGCPGGPGPQPIMYWNVWPQNSTHGGELYSCDYDQTGGYCIYGQMRTVAHS